MTSIWFAPPEGAATPATPMEWPAEKTRRPGCGRFARYVKTDRYYDGRWDQIAIVTDCKACGVLEERCA